MKIDIWTDSGLPSHLEAIIDTTIKWCVRYFDLKNKKKLSFTVKVNSRKNCWGYCLQGDEDHSYEIYVADNQTIRDFLATLTHEMVHVKQWETGCWGGEGEKEAEKLQYLLADEIWKQGLI